MPSVTLGVDADVACWSSGIAAGAGDHLPIGVYGSANYRSAIRFNPPAWGSWVAITKATLSFYISDHQHVAPKNSSIYIQRQNLASVWTKSEGTQDCESGFSGGNNTQYDDINPITTNRVSFASGSTANAKKSVVVTDMVKAMFAQGHSKLVFVFDNVGSGDYTELWSEGKSGGYNAELVIEYTTAAPPAAPTLLTPGAAATIEDTTPNFSWTHNDPDPQSAADVELYDAAGTTLLHTYSVVGAANNVDGTDVLTRGTTYQWRARTYDAVSGVGAWSALATFTVRALPVVVVSSTRRMVFANGAPRLAVAWTVDQPQTHYRVQSSAGYDSGWVAGSDLLHTLSTQAVVSGTAQTITVSSRSSYGALEGSSSQAFTPRYGLTTHRRDLGAAPLNWGSPVIVSTVPTDASLVIEYGSDVAAIAAPSAWFSSLSPVPKKRYLFWRAWFIPSAVAGPSLDTITIPVDATVTLVDKWGTTRDTPGLAVPWGIDPGEAVYGTRSMTVDADGTARKVYSYGMKVRAGRSYILTGLMKSQGNSGAHFRLEDSGGNILNGGGIVSPPGPVQSDVLAATKDWFDASTRDVNRYRTVVWVAPADMTVYVVLGAQGAAGAKAWWDAIKLEESTVATPWSPGAIGATVIDAGGVQIDGSRGGVFRYKGTLGVARATVEGGPTGLVFAGDTEVTSPADGALAVDGVPVQMARAPIRRVYTANATWTKPANLSHIEVEVVGGGGSGGGTAATGAGEGASSGGAGGGGYAKKLLTAADLAALATAAVVVGQATSTPATGAAGATGNASSFSGTGITTVSGLAGGGGGASGGTAGGSLAAGGVGGAASGGDINIGGGDGVQGTVVSGSRAALGYGGGTVLGPQTRNTASQSGQAGSPYGGGGTGANSLASTGARSGGPGAAGVVIVTEYYL